MFPIMFSDRERLYSKLGTNFQFIRKLGYLFSAYSPWLQRNQATENRISTFPVNYLEILFCFKAYKKS